MADVVDPKAAENSAEPAKPEASTAPVAEETKPEPTPATTETPAEAPKEEAKAAEAAEALPSYSGPVWPDFADDHPLAQFLAALPKILESTGHNDVYGVTLKTKTDGPKADFGTLLILQKFLRANQNDLEKAKEQLSKTLAWRKEFQPEKAAAETFKKEKFGGLGYITTSGAKGGEGKPQIVTWNIYGAVKDYEKTFVPLDEFLRWRIGLMEQGVSKLGLANATEPIPDFGKGEDPYHGIQVHDYKNVSFLRMDPKAKAASKSTIQLLGDYYPETLSRKFFVNVPIIMQWMFGTMKLFVSAETTKKFVVLSDGTYVVGELGESVPNEYGGKAGALEAVGEGMKLE